MKWLYSTLGDGSLPKTNRGSWQDRLQRERRRVGGGKGIFCGGGVTKFIVELGALGGEASLFGEGGHFRRRATELPVLMCNVTPRPTPGRRTRFSNKM